MLINYVRYNFSTITHKSDTGSDRILSIIALTNGISLYVDSYKDLTFL